MDQVTIWYFRDNNESDKLVEAVKGIGLSVSLISGYDVGNANINDHEINIVIIDIIDEAPGTILEKVSHDARIQSCLKFMFLPKKDIIAASKLSYNLIHVEFISRPVNPREFLLLLEKSVIVERYREIMKFISKEAETRIETYEGLMDINRKNIFESEKEKEAFEKILHYEKNLMREQSRLNRAIKDFTLLRQSEYFDMKSRIKAEEMLADLRRKELLDARDIIDAQESVLDYSANELKGAQEIINAVECAAELGRQEALQLHSGLKDQIEINNRLCIENKKLRDEVSRLREEVNKRR
ncbi:MAG TPA: hypothetical protein PK926_14810 [Spirochaetota bacterium]|nr:hypothetical protein [Spirochaetota bacterium]HPI89938.1 hypothetical protein [Spirochaetota bacterium]HPR48463.1 hypothetical protein [Spirochaetota bacterium]